ncbi:MAG: carboxypeptidase-like regulatory domain-containing protein [Chitinophagaceae bacterium]|nr:MAG: carboxypeptidase-like regulatory domain-containing protein [Chitinophagaceae bacterium]
MRLVLPLVLWLLCNSNVSAQKIYGTVFTEQGDLLPYSSLTVKGTSIGASANDKAKFSFVLSRGTYTIVCQHIGYTTIEKKLTITEDTELSFVLPLQKLEMTEVVVKSGSEDPAYEMIRQAIKKREFYNKQVKAFEVDLYAKDMVKLRKMPKKIFGKKIPDADVSEMGLDSSGKGIIYLSESVAKVATQQPDKFKMNVISSRISGSGGFGFTFPAFISLYSNNVKVFTERINPRGFISPIADGALGFYKYKFLGTFWEDGKAINSIRVTPRRTYEPLFTGVINIIDDEWRIHSFDMMVTKSAQLELLDTLKITQQHVPVTKEIWRTKNQVLYFNFKQFGIDAVGNFVNVYSNYKVDPKFGKKYFDNVIIKYDTAVNKRSKEYWDTIRPVPLEPEEFKDYQVKDSLYEMRKDSALTQAALDSLRKKQGKLKPLKFFWGGVNRRIYQKEKTVAWGVQPLIPDLEYNTVEGVTMKVNGYVSAYNKRLKSTITFEPHLRYGFNNGHFNAWGSLQFRTRDSEASKRIKQYSWNFSGGKRVSEFNKNQNTNPLINSISTLLYGENRMKIYENYFGSVTYSRRFESGLRFTVNGLFENRLPLENTTKFTFSKKDSINFTPNYPVQKMTEQFQQHQAAVITASISFKPGQKYIEFPNYKAAIGSKYPTFTLSYAKGIDDILGSDVDFDKWKFSVRDDKNLKLLGTFKYNLGVGGFLNNKKVYLQDYQHFRGNMSIAAGEYLTTFQVAEPYQNSTNENFYTYGHIEHHFNGLLTNKIPLFKRLNWTLVAGSNALYINKNTHHIEAFAGIENILKLFRVDFVAAYINGGKPVTEVRIGAGGILGGSININRNRSDGLGF